MLPGAAPADGTVPVLCYRSSSSSWSESVERVQHLPARQGE